MSSLTARARSRWPLAALLGGGLLATLLALLPARADALDAPGYCSSTGVFFCFRPEIGQNEFGLWEIRLFYAGPNGSPTPPWIF